MRAVLFLLTICSCAEEAHLCEEKEPLVDPEGWAFVDPENDALWPLPAGRAACAADAIQIQSFGADVAVEIDTRFGCGWATVSQPTQVPLQKAEVLQVRVFYFSQTTFPEAQAEVAVAIDGDILSSSLVDIPTSSELLAPRIEIDRDIPQGSTALFHVGNHGDNSWNLIELARIFKAPCPEPAEEP